MQLTNRFSAALTFASQLHATQLRKGSGVPYAAHLLSVTGIVLQYGGREDEAIAALLHDAVEDQGGLPVLEKIRSRFGAEVAAIVEGCTDAYTNPKPAWRERKEKYIAHLQAASPSVRLVCAADKLDNIRAILQDYRIVGEEVWSRFEGC
jgi:(p)ppGpp synthase/HD superfamily hydrolase